jgi:hypothetical protein
MFVFAEGGCSARSRSSLGKDVAKDAAEVKQLGLLVVYGRLVQMRLELIPMLYWWSDLD